MVTLLFDITALSDWELVGLKIINTKIVNSHLKPMTVIGHEVSQVINSIFSTWGAKLLRQGLDQLLGGEVKLFKLQELKTCPI